MSLPLKGKILALDLGTRRTGVSISDADQKIAFLRDELEHTSVGELLAHLKKLTEADDVVGILAGLPLHMNGQRSEQTERVLNQIEKLKSLNLPIKTIDERLSTEEAFAPKMKIVDSRAAQILLENFIRTKL
mgnify:FL=1